MDNQPTSASGEVKAKRWKFSIGRLIALVTCAAVSFAMMNLANAIDRRHNIGAMIIGWSGVGLLFGSMGGFCGHLLRGTKRAYLIGFICGVVCIGVMVVVASMVVFLSQ